jgi:4-hydroxy-3-methylbut-2-enyl diphosphate reductase
MLAKVEAHSAAGSVRRGETMRVVLAQPRGFCAGVERAIEIVERALEKYGPPIYVRHEIVHNRHVVERLRAKGAHFVDEIDEIPPGSVTIFSAHGVASAIEQRAGARGLPVIDATCPLVSKVHIEGQRYANQGREIVLIGHAGHPEIEGTMGRIDGRVHLISRPEEVARLEVTDPDRLAFITQTTLSVDDTRAVIDTLKERFPTIVGPNTKDICYATQNRQGAARELARIVDVVLVVGAPNSSNSNRLREIAAESGVASYLIEDAGALDPLWLKDASAVGITAGASAPAELVEELIARLREMTEVELSVLPGVTENVRFRMPSQLSDTRG